MMATAAPGSAVFLLLVLLLLQSTGQGACGKDDLEFSPKIRECLASNVTLPCLLSQLPAPSLGRASSVRWTRVPSQSNAVEQLVLEAVDGTIHWGEGFQDRAEMLSYAYNHCDASLTLTGLRSSDSGIYRCEITLGVDCEQHTVPLVVTGAVFHYRMPSAHVGLSFSQAQQACLENSAQVATPAQLLAAFWDGYESCDAGWLSDRTVSVSIQFPRPGCHSDGDRSPGVRSLGYRDPNELYDVYCYIEELQGEVFHSTVPGKLSLVRAAAHCRALGAHLATAGQLHLAWRAGLDQCNPGWLADGSVRYPIVQPRAECGGVNPGIRTLYHNADLTGVPASSALFDAYCYREQEASRQFLHTRSRLPASHNEASVTSPPSSSNPFDPQLPKQTDRANHEQEGPHPTTDRASPPGVGSQSRPRWSNRVGHVDSEGPLEGNDPGPTFHPGSAGLGNPGNHQLMSGKVDTTEDEKDKGHRGQFSIPSPTPEALNGDRALPDPLGAIVVPGKGWAEDSTVPLGTAVQKDMATPPGIVTQEDEGAGGTAEPKVTASEANPAEGSHWPLDTPLSSSTGDTVHNAGPVERPSPISSGTRGEMQWTPESDQKHTRPLGPEHVRKTISLGTNPLATATSELPEATTTDTPEGFSGEDREQESSLAAQSQKESDGSGLDQAAMLLAGSPGGAWKDDTTAEVRGQIMYSHKTADAMTEPGGTTTTVSIMDSSSVSPTSPDTADRPGAEDNDNIHRSHFREAELHSTGPEESFSNTRNRGPSERGSPLTPQPSQTPQTQPVPSQQTIEHGTVISFGLELQQANSTQLFPDVDNCQSKPCQNGATCIDKVDSFVCLCLPSYGGETCEKDTEGCEHGWKKFHGHCYRYFPRRHTWENAEKDCREHGAHLASVHSTAEQDFLAGLSHENTWIGLNDRTVEEDFQWTDNMELEYENWRENQPDNFFAGGEDCVVMVAHEDGRWNDVPCNYNLPYICKKGTVLCGPPPSVENTVLIGRKRETYDIHSVVRYQCADGFLQRHVPTAKCRANGRWDRPRIVCTKGRRSHRHRRHHHKNHRERRKHRKHRGGTHGGHAHNHTHL